MSLREMLCRACGIRWIIEAPIPEGSRLHVLGDFTQACAVCRARFDRIQNALREGVFEEVSFGRWVDGDDGEGA